MDETVVVDSAQAGAQVIDPPEELTPIEEAAPPNPDAPASTDSLADAIRNKFKATKKPDPPKADTETPAKPESAKTPKAAKAKPKAEPRHDVDPIKLAEAQGREIGDRIAKGMKGAETPAPPAVATQSDEEIANTLPEEYRSDVAVYSEMKRMYPDKHGKIFTRLKEAAVKETKYIEDWEAQHPDEKYDPDDAAHNAFYKKTFPEIPERDFEAAKDSLKEARVEARIEARFDAKYKSQLETIQKEKAAEKIAPLMSQRIGDVIESALGAIDEQLVAIARDPAKLNTLHETNPVAADVIGAVHNAFSPLMVANIGIHQGAVEIDPKNGAHVQLFQLAQEIEKKTASAPLEQRMDAEGRVFATRAQYNQMSPEEQAGHWFVDQDVLAYVISKKAATAAKQWYDFEQEKYKKWAKTNGITLPSETAKPPTAKQDGNGEHQNGAPKPAPRSVSPPAPGRGQVPSPWSANDSQPKTGGQYFLKSLRGR